MRTYRPTFPLVARRTVAGRAFGPMPSARRGPGWDLAGARPYRPGDDVRRLDWRATARLSSARDRDELVVREHATERATAVATVVDGGASMALFPSGLPWLHKPAAVAEARALIADSAVRARCALHEDGAAGAPLEAALARLAEGRRLPPGSFVFVLSDFLAPVADDAWRAPLARRWDVVPVVVQDPTWEQSFPDVAGAVLAVADPGGGRARVLAPGRRDVAARRRANERRLAALLDRFRALGLDWVLLSREDPRGVVEAFRAWADVRRSAGGIPA